MAKNNAVVNGRPFIISEFVEIDLDLDGALNDLISPSRKSANTWISYGTQIHTFINFINAQDLDWKKTTSDDIKKYYRVRTSGLSTTGKPIKSKSWNIAAISLVHLFEYAVRKKIIDRPPFEYRRSKAYFAFGARNKEAANIYSKASDEQINFININEYKNQWRYMVLETRYAQRNLILSDLLISTGLRISEALNLEVQNIPDPDNADFVGKKTITIRVKGKGGKIRSVRIPKKIAREIRRYIDEERVLQLKHIKLEKNKTKKIFLSKSGKKLSSRDVERMFEKISKIIGTKLTPHGLRHTFAIYQLEAMIKKMMINLKEIKENGSDAYRQILNDPLRELQKLLGHTHISTVYVYLDFLEETEALVEESIDSWTQWTN